ncbi:sugar ABC transporter substrate-binding protein [Boudabousia liubingyangii]|uniref:Probable sugar-binding periplasmic protein n=1 Tax=Boudabousia liubingyangii TaxID=1921764 RepID=A0A1Q5PJN7_9ACTO|nr:ABC transporter substrate-binding protein [Boudabousia liubingyangii]OKL46150.1 sugar ABC transporter substrate-binding protein [Boudabousia liubingyangii]OKL46299.1 sugar ABC transporter substrate-binding protein [Boudabousia liubingyangii]
MRRKLYVVPIAAAMTLSLAACGGSENSGGGTSEAGGDKVVDVVSWWSAGSEKDGLEALVKVFEKQHAGIKFVNQAVAGGAGSQAKQKLAADLAAGNPPDTYQAHAGAELDEAIKAQYLDDVSPLYDEFKLRDAFPKTLVDRLSVDGKIYSIPTNIHRSNVVWANTAVLKEVGLDPNQPAADMDAWIADMEKIKAAGKTPITIGMEWTQLNLFENILLADLGAEGYNGLFDGKTDWNGDGVKKAIAHYKKILDLADKSMLGEDWEPAMKPVVDGSAAYNVMGDWALASFNNAQKKAPEDYVYFAVPGTKGTFNFLADSFTLPTKAKHKDTAKDWLNTCASVEGQVAFNTIKGSIPARSDIPAADLEKFSDYQKSAMEDFKKDTIVSSIAHGAAVPAPVSNAMLDALGKFAQGASDEATLQAELAKAAESLKK